MKFIILLTILNSINVFASEISLNDCSETAKSVQLQNEMDQFDNNCRDIVFQQTNILQRITSEDSSVSVFGSKNLVFMSHLEIINGEQITKKSCLVGTKSKIDEVHRLKIDLESKWFISCLFNENVIKSFRYEIGGDQLAMREFSPESSHLVQSFAFNNDYLIVLYKSGKIVFFSKKRRRSWRASS